MPKRIICKLFYFFWLMRLPIVSVTILLALVSFKFSGSQNYCVLASLACIYIAGYIQNDIFDIKIDSISAPHRPLPSGRVSIGEAKIGYIVFISLGLVISILIHEPYYTVYLLATTGAFYIYTRYCKSNWILKNLFTAVVSTSVIFIPLLFHEKRTVNMLLLSGMAFLFTFGREAFMDIRDREGDKILPFFKRPHMAVSGLLSICSLAASFCIKEMCFLNVSIFRYVMYLVIVLFIYFCFAKKTSKYWIASESMKIIFIYDLVTIYFK